MDAARRRAIPVGELQARFKRGKLLRRTTPALTGPSPVASQGSQVSGEISSGYGELHNSDEEERGGRGPGLVPMDSSGGQLSPVATCREHSTSAWLHFPHVELVVLFFAFEGAVASFAAAMRHSECPEIFYTALVALVSAIIPPTNRAHRFPVSGCSLGMPDLPSCLDLQDGAGE